MTDIISEDQLAARRASSADISADVNQAHEDAVSSQKRLTGQVEDEVLAHVTTMDSFAARQQALSEHANHVSSIINRALNYGQPQQAPTTSPEGRPAPTVPTQPTATPSGQQPTTPEPAPAPAQPKPEAKFGFRVQGTRVIVDASESTGEKPLYFEWRRGDKDGAIVAGGEQVEGNLPGDSIHIGDDLTLRVRDKDNSWSDPFTKRITLEGVTATLTLVEPAEATRTARTTWYSRRWNFLEWLGAFVGAGLFLLFIAAVTWHPVVVTMLGMHHQNNWRHFWITVWCVIIALIGAGIGARIVSSYLRNREGRASA